MSSLTPTPSSRRSFLQTSAATLGGLVLGFRVPLARRAYAAAAAEAAAAGSFAPNAFLRIGSDDTLTVLLAHSELGQGVWTSLPMLIAEELDADWSKIKVEHAPAAPAYFHTTFGRQATGGSTSTSSEFERYRQAGAMARALLVQAGAQRFGVPAAQCRTENGKVIAGDKSARYGELADAAAQLPPPKTVALKEPERWTLIGKPTRRLDSTQMAAAGILGLKPEQVRVHTTFLGGAFGRRAPINGDFFIEAVTSPRPRRLP